MNRGGFYSNSAKNFRCGGMNSNRWTIVHNGIGFRFVNGANRGGSYLGASYEGHRSAKRVSSDKARGYGNVGFRFV